MAAVRSIIIYMSTFSLQAAAVIRLCMFINSSSRFKWISALQFPFSSPVIYYRLFQFFLFFKRITKTTARFTSRFAIAFRSTNVSLTAINQVLIIFILQVRRNLGRMYATWMRIWNFIFKYGWTSINSCNLGISICNYDFFCLFIFIYQL